MNRKSYRMVIMAVLAVMFLGVPDLIKMGRSVP
jgi:hypothetical protein